MENSVIKAIETRRSVRSFSQKAIPGARIPTLTTARP